MPATKQKKKVIQAPPSSITLLDFFSSKIVGEVTPDKRIQKQKLISQEVIVIDDSDDEEPGVLDATRALKRRKLNAGELPASSIQQASVAIRSEASFSTKGRLKREICHESESTSAPLSFGVPTLLLGSNTRVTSVKPCSNASRFDGMVLDDRNQCAPGPSKFNVPALPPKVSSKPNFGGEAEVDIDLTLDDWEMGDDEKVVHATGDCDVADESADLCLEAASISTSTLKILESPVPSCFDLSRNRLKSRQEKLGSTSSLPLESPVDCEVAGCSNKQKRSESNAFSILMTSNRDNEAWKEAAVAEEKSFRVGKANGGRRKAPFYKVMQGMPIAVDAFRYGTIPGVTAYFLTHAHSDHYTNLSSTWQSGPIYCSQGTANLIIHMLSVDRKWVHPLPMDVPTIIPNTNGVQVTLIEANHCPGSCLFFFEGLQTVDAGDSRIKSPFIGSSKVFRYLHCGDFRASPRHVVHPAVKGKPIDHVYLDTTYLDPQYTFPPQPLVISACAEFARKMVSDQPIDAGNATIASWLKPLNSIGKSKHKEVDIHPLVVVGTYSIGKERIVKAIAHALKTKIYCDARKAAILRCQEDPELNALLTSKPMDAIVHLVPLGMITSDGLKTYLDRFKGSYTKVIGFRPTGWTFSQAAGADQLPSVSCTLARTQQKNFTCADLRPSGKPTSTLQIIPVPYSEHSSFYELTCFAMSFDWVKMIATVNVGSETSRGKMSKWVSRWEAERKKRGATTVVPHRHPDYW